MTEGGRVLPPVKKTVRVMRLPESAFRRFTAEIAEWWPLRTHSVAQQRARTVVFEPRVGGEIYEVDDAGKRCVWGTVLEWVPPERVRFTWHPGRDSSTAGEVDVRFVAEAGRYAARAGAHGVGTAAASGRDASRLCHRVDSGARSVG